MKNSRYRIIIPQVPHFVTCTLANWLPLFADPEIAGIVLNSIRHLQAENKLRLHGYVLMENHLHLVASASDLGKTLSRFKAFTGLEIVKILRRKERGEALRILAVAGRRRDGRREHQVWESGFHPRMISSEEMLRQKLSYIHHNPVRRGYVDEPIDWRNSSARNYAGMKGVLEFEMVEL